MICDLLSESQGKRPRLSSSSPVEPADELVAGGLCEDKVGDTAANVTVVW